MVSMTVRRESDIRSGPRTGAGRRARDRLLTGTPPATAGPRPDSDLEHLLLFVGDDLRESALAVGGIEAFLVQVRGVLENGDAGELAPLADSSDLDDRLAALDTALTALRRSLRRVSARPVP